MSMRKQDTLSVLRGCNIRNYWRCVFSKHVHNLSFYEMITLSTFPLVAHKETPEARSGAKVYFVFLFGASVAFLLSAIFLTYYATGTLDFSYQGIFSDARGKGLSDIFLIVTFGLFIAGTSKAAMMPFHAWLPRAMVAPTPVSAFYMRWQL